MPNILTRTLTPCLLLALLLPSGRSLAADDFEIELPHQAHVPVSLQREGESAVQRAAVYLLGKQQSDGSWGHFPALTAMVCVALNNCHLPGADLARVLALEKGRRHILNNAQPDGAICTPDRKYANYSTSVCLTGLAILGNPNDIPVMRNARRYLVDQQLDEDNPLHPVEQGDPNYGGFGYGKSKGDQEKTATFARADLSCTQWALEALFVTDFLDHEPFSESPQTAGKTDLAWDKALGFLKAAQNLAKSKEGAWLVTNERDGGFSYLPNTESDSQRSYGSMTYAGLKSMLYADLTPDDPRIKAALDWASQHYTMDENPGVGANGHYYYLLTFAKANAATGAETLTTTDGKAHSWRHDLVQKLLELQKGEGQWLNDRSGRWQESNPDLVTAYAMISLELALSH